MNVLRCWYWKCLVILAGSVLLTSGCGDDRPQRVSVSGQVLYNGKPLTKGFVRVVPHKGRVAAGKLNAEGRFTLSTYEKNDGCLLGTHAVEILCFDNSNPSVSVRLIPVKYTKIATSGLRATIEGPTDNLTFNLSSTP